MEGVAWESLLWSDKEGSGNFWGLANKWCPVWGNCVHTGRKSYWMCIAGRKGWHDTASEVLMPRRWVLRDSEGKAHESLFPSLAGAPSGWSIHMYTLHKSLGCWAYRSSICYLSSIIYLNWTMSTRHLTPKSNENAFAKSQEILKSLKIIPPPGPAPEQIYHISLTKSCPSCLSELAV